MLPAHAAVTFEDIKNRQVRQYELTEIIIQLGDGISLLDRWRALSPRSFRSLDFTQAYMLAGDRLLNEAQTNQALLSYVRAYQNIGAHPEKERAAYLASFLLYAGDKRPEALFYANRAVELTSKASPFFAKIYDLKRRIVWRYFSRLDNLPDNAISAVSFDGDDVWIGTWSGGLVRYTRSSAMISIYNPTNSKLPSFFIRDVLVRPDRVWVGMHSGLALFDKKTASWQSFPQFSKFSFKRLIADENGTIYAATLYNGVYASTNEGASWKNIVPQKTVLDLAISGGKLYIATAEQGVYVFENGELSSLLPKITAKSLLPEGGKLWVGSYGDGLLSLDIASGRVLKTYGEAELGSVHIENLCMVDDMLWVGLLDRGAVRFDGRRWVRFGLRDGLPGLELTTITREKEYLWFGTLAGGLGVYLFKEIAPPEAQ